MRNLSWLLVAVLAFNAGDAADKVDTNVTRANRVRERLAPMSSDEFNIRVKGGRFHVRGVVESTDDAQRVMDAILQEADVKEIHLQLGIGQEPSVYVQATRASQMGNWLDQFDRPSFNPDELPSPTPRTRVPWPQWKQRSP